jgi:hypothetical protein
MSICQRIQSVGGVRARDPDHYVIWVTQPIARRSSLRDQSDRRDAVAESGQNDHYKDNSAPCRFDDTVINSVSLWGLSWGRPSLGKG